MNDFIASFLSGLVVAIFSKISDKLNLGTFFTNLLCGFMATVAAYFFTIQVLPRMLRLQLSQL